MSNRSAQVGLRPPRSSAADQARLNGLLAVELDVVRRRERAADHRLAAGVLLALSLVVAEALLAGVGVPAACLDVEWTAALGLEGTVVLDEALALAVLAAAPLVSHA